MVRDNRVFYEKGTIILFATKHEKEVVLRPLLSTLGLQCEAVSVDTDIFGTFSGEVERVGSVRETLRKKVRSAINAQPNAQLFLASEGSFDQHPLLRFLKTGLESLLFYDRERDFEIYVENLDQNPNHHSMSFGPNDDIESFLDKIDFPRQGVMVHSENSLNTIFKGLHDSSEVLNAMDKCFQAHPEMKVSITTDLRAMHSPKRQLCIAKAGESLIERLQSYCPSCRLPGYWIVRTISGLPCECCGAPSSATKKVVFGCVKCEHQKISDRPDGKSFIDSAECHQCNP